MTNFKIIIRNTMTSFVNYILYNYTPITYIMYNISQYILLSVGQNSGYPCRTTWHLMIIFKSVKNSQRLQSR